MERLKPSMKLETQRPTVAEIDLGALRANFRALRALASHGELMVVVKADAYGHGAVTVARALIDEGCRHFGVATLDEAREVAQQNLLDLSGYKKFKEVIAAQGGNPQVLDKFELLPNASGVREISSPRAGYVSVIDAEDIGQASNMIGAGRDKKEDAIDPAVGIILEVKVGEKVDAGSVLCRLYYTREDRVEEAAEMVEDAFRISAQKPDERELILEVVG